MQPRNPQFESRVRQSFARQKVMSTLGARLEKVEPGRVEIEFGYHPDFTQQHGFLHAGVVATVLDSACGYAAFSLMDADSAVLTVEYKVNLVAPAQGESFKAVAQVVKSGRTLSVCRGEAHGDGKLVALMTGTIMAIRDRPGVES